MENGKENGEKTAFPNGGGVAYGGLTKREYFSAMAMQGILANAIVIESVRIGSAQFIAKIDVDKLAKIALECADELLEKLEKNENGRTA